MARRFDLAVIGSGPGGQKGAIAAAKAGKTVVLAEGPNLLGGVCLTTGTIPSKTLREAVLYLTGARHRAFYGDAAAVKQQIRVEDLHVRVDEVLRMQREVITDQLHRNGVEVISGTARFADAHTLEIDTEAGVVTVEADHFLIACGTRPARREDLPFDHPAVRDADQVLQRLTGELSSSAIVIGGGVIGLEYAAMGVALGMKITVIEARDELLGFVDREIVEHLTSHLVENGATFLLGEQVEAVEPLGERNVRVKLKSGGEVLADSVLYAVGRQANSDRLNLDAIPLPTGDRGRIEVDEEFRTRVPHIYAAGDVVGFPALASTSAEQGRVAASHMFGLPHRHSPELLPYGIYTIPEISTVGKNERELKKAGVPHAVGRAWFRELARAQIIGDRTGMLKLLFDPRTLRILGVHVIGDGASELVHIGLAAMMAGGTVEDLRDTVFNYPTLAEAYKVAALNGLNAIE